MCKLFKVSRNGYYSYTKANIKQADPILASLVKSTFEESMQTYGTRRIKRLFEKEYGWVVSRRRVAKTMRTLNLKVKSKKRFRVITTDSKHNLAISPNRLTQDFYAPSPNRVYVGDITYIKTTSGWIYLATVIDLYSRSIVGYAIDDRLHTKIIVNALNMARLKRISLQGAIFHSDRGSQYASDEFRAHLGKYGMIQSMSAKGNCYDNAVAESFFHTIKTELIHHMRFESKEEVIKAVVNYINFYNTKRLHSYNNYLSPLEAEMRWWISEHEKVLKVA